MIRIVTQCVLAVIVGFLLSLAVVWSAKASPFVLLVYETPVQISSASGFHVGGGIVVTAAHFTHDVMSPEALSVVDEDGSEYKASVISVDVANDIGIVRLEDWDSIDEIAIDCDPTFELGEELQLHASTIQSGPFTMFGRVANAKRIPRYDWPSAILVDASIFEGMSGGAVVNPATGLVVGVNSAVFADRENGTLNLGVVVPSNAVCELLDR